MIWKVDTQVHGPHGASTSNHGPALASSGSRRLYLAYTGTNNYLYWSWVDVAPGTDPGNFGPWQGDEQVKWHGNSPLQSQASPALVVGPHLSTSIGSINPLILLSLTSAFDDVLVSYFDGNQWNGYKLGALLVGATLLGSVSAIFAGNQLHVIVTNRFKGLYHLVCAGSIADPSSWAVVETPAGEAESWANMNAIGPFLYRLTQDKYAIYGFDSAKGIFQTQPQQTGLVEVADGSPLMRAGAVLGSWDSNPHFVYGDAGGDQMYTAAIRSYVNNNMLLSPSVPLTAGGVQVKTDRQTSLVVPHELYYCMAHKGNGNSKLYLTVGF